MQKDFILVIQHASSLFEGKLCGRCIFTELSDIFPFEVTKRLLKSLLFISDYLMYSGL